MTGTSRLSVVTRRLLALAALGEASLGLVMLSDPAIAARLLLGVGDLVGVGEVIARVTGIALIGLGVSCWPGSTALAGILTYGVVLTPACLLELAGATASVFVLVALVAALVVSLHRSWTRMAVRVLVSWIAASGPFMVGWFLRDGHSEGKTEFMAFPVRAGCPAIFNA